MGRLTNGSACSRHCRRVRERKEGPRSAVLASPRAPKLIEVLHMMCLVSSAALGSAKAAAVVRNGRCWARQMPCASKNEEDTSKIEVLK
eukprot:1155310-Pelagomonas_calceolata.AAC.6